MHGSSSIVGVGDGNNWRGDNYEIKTAHSTLIDSYTDSYSLV